MKKYKIIIFILAAIIGISALIYFVFIPQIESSFVLWLKNTIAKEEISNLEEKKADLNNLKKAEKEAEDLSNTLAVMLPNKKEQGEFMIEVEALSANVKVNFVDIKFSEEKKTAPPAAASSEESINKKSTVKGAATEKFKEMIFELTAKGSYQDIMNFLRGLEKINRAITIEKCNLSETKGTVQASIKGKAYYQND
ncbi:MAG: hypothetical protein CEN92_457 [Candidatus Berkelbacteria bacterium Licking1014_96]|uniref:Type IV pilus assembly protein PilO n=1 Tax=Candidatus Berkelbacteria bacterium Licking1014_96 TaxID=2017149 RepID=A0A554LCD5_9BACT|nr:MAG: hypothetical protein CEN92_457 [Candidatus Berkelbacteria bacterium Licking1014_96]